MADSTEPSDYAPSRKFAGSDQWLGGEAFLGQEYRGNGLTARRRVWSLEEGFILFLGGLTLGTALGVIFSRPNK